MAPIRTLLLIPAATLLMQASLAQSDTKTGKNSSEYHRALSVISKSTEGARSASRTGVYNKRRGTLQILNRPALSFAINEPRTSEAAIFWLCDIDVFCCIDTEPSGCTDYILACAELGGEPTSINGGMGGTCDCSDSDGNGHPQC